MDTVQRTLPAILVDFNTLRGDPQLIEWLWETRKNASVVLLVTDPLYHDYDPENDEYNADHGILNLDFDVVLRNSAKAPLPDVAFKTAALCIVQDTSNLVPVIGVDRNFAVRAMYREGGVLAAFESGPGRN